MTPMDLQDALNAFLETNIASKCQYKTLDQNRQEFFKNPAILSGYPIPNRAGELDESSIYPYILTRLDKLEFDEKKGTDVATMLIFVGLYDEGIYDANGDLVPDSSGYRDVWNLLENIRQELFKQQVLDKKHKIVDDWYSAEFLEDYVYPYWQGMIATKWHIGNIRRERI